MRDQVQATIDTWRGEHAADPRLTLCDVRAEDHDGGVRLVGETLDGLLAAGLLAQLGRDFPGLQLHDQICRLAAGAAPRCVARAVINVRREPTERSEVMTQALLGERVAALKAQNGFTFVRLDADGYLGWIADHALSLALPPPVTHRVVVPLADLYADAVGDRWVGKAPLGVTVAAVDRRGERLALALPAGLAWVAATDLLPLADGPAPETEGMAWALRLVARCVGTPYLWGGRSPFGFDCSGLAQTVLGLVGVLAPRDADMQYAAGRPVAGEPQAGDLLFFGRPGYSASGIARTGGVSHAAVSLGGSEYLHASSTVWTTTYGSLDVASGRAYNATGSRFLDARRMPCA